MTLQLQTEHKPRAPLPVRTSISLAADQALNAAADMHNPRQAAEHCAIALEILRLECIADDLSPFALRAILSALLDHSPQCTLAANYKGTLTKAIDQLSG